MKEKMLSLLPGVRAEESNGSFTLTLNGKTCFTADQRQAAILRALLGGPQPVGGLIALLHENSAPGDGGAFDALTLADFILQYKDFLEP